LVREVGHEGCPRRIRKSPLLLSLCGNQVGRTLPELLPLEALLSVGLHKAGKDLIRTLTTALEGSLELSG